MSNNIVQLTDSDNNNVYPIAGAAAQGSITKAMLEEGVFEGTELSEPSTVAYVATDNIQNGAVTTAKIANDAVNSSKVDWANFNTEGSDECREALGGSGNYCFQLSNGTDLNTATDLKKKSGFFMGAGLVNGPMGRGSTDWLYIINMVHNPNYTVQIAIPFEMSRIFYRRYYNSSWGSWLELADKNSVPTVTLSTTDIGEGATLAANTLYGVYA